MKLPLLALMLFSLLANLLSAEIDIGATAPQVTALYQNGESTDLGKALKEGYALVFFYPKALTGGCTKQVCSIRDSWDELKDRGIKVFGVSSDTTGLQKEFSDRYELPFQLIADSEAAVSKAFGKGKWSRQAYLFKDGVLVWRDLNASTAKQAEDVLTAIDALEK